MNRLLPERHPNQDFFIGDIFDNLPFKDDMATMEHPVFSLSKKPDFRCISYKKDDIVIDIAPSAKYGLPTIFDKDVLLYCGSLLMQELNTYEKAVDRHVHKLVEKERQEALEQKGQPYDEAAVILAEGESYENVYRQARREIPLPPKTLRISTHDLLVATNRPTGGDSYNRLRNALSRLSGVRIQTNIRTNKRLITNDFGLITSWTTVESSRVKKRMLKLEITLSDWFYNSIIGKEVLTISRDYFRLRKPLERRLYEIARKHCGKQIKWEIGLKKLQKKTGSTSHIDKFRYFIKEISQDNYLPGYVIELTDDDEKDTVTFKRRKDTATALPDHSDILTISTQAMELAKKRVFQANTGWDLYAIIEEFYAYIKSVGKPKNINAAFIGFVKKKIQNRP